MGQGTFSLTIARVATGEEEAPLSGLFLLPILILRLAWGSADMV
jgi:hypothetical protein